MENQNIQSSLFTLLASLLITGWVATTGAQASIFKDNRFKQRRKASEKREENSKPIIFPGRKTVAQTHKVHAKPKWKRSSGRKRKLSRCGRPLIRIPRAITFATEGRPPSEQLSDMDRYGARQRIGRFSRLDQNFAWRATRTYPANLIRRSWH